MYLRLGQCTFQVLRLFTAKQLEIAVAGEPEFDVAFWREHTEYKGYRPEDATVDLFWKVKLRYLIALVHI